MGVTKIAVRRDHINVIVLWPYRAFDLGYRHGCARGKNAGEFAAVLGIKVNHDDKGGIWRIRQR